MTLAARPCKTLPSTNRPGARAKQKTTVEMIARMRPHKKGVDRDPLSANHPAIAQSPRVPWGGHRLTGARAQEDAEDGEE
ncbi:MAG: hypothetical protein Q9215_003500 [Flavoplaca cf. flavocitrina]